MPGGGPGVRRPRCRLSLALSGLPITPLPGANAAQRAAVVPMAAAKPAGPATPTLGPSPYECLTVCSGYGSTLEASSLASVSVMPKLVHVGQVVTARITQNAPKQAVLGYRWELNDLPAGAAGAAGTAGAAMAAVAGVSRSTARQAASVPRVSHDRFIAPP